MKVIVDLDEQLRWSNGKRMIEVHSRENWRRGVGIVRTGNSSSFATKRSKETV